jgi:hypothetical protein
MAECSHFLTFRALGNHPFPGTENRSVGGSIPPLGTIEVNNLRPNARQPKKRRVRPTAEPAMGFIGSPHLADPPRAAARSRHRPGEAEMRRFALCGRCCCCWGAPRNRRRNTPPLWRSAARTSPRRPGIRFPAPSATTRLEDATPRNDPAGKLIWQTRLALAEKLAAGEMPVADARLKFSPVGGAARGVIAVGFFGVRPASLVSNFGVSGRFRANQRLHLVTNSPVTSK